MKIIYLSADPGIDVDKPLGGGAHIHGTITQLRKMGHQIILAAPGRKIEERRYFKPVEKHLWFKGLLGIKACLLREKSTKQGAPVLSLGSKIQDETVNAAVDLKPQPGLPGQGRGIKEKLVIFFYGPFHHFLNQVEEHTGYKIRFRRAVTYWIHKEQPDAVYERYALGHHWGCYLCRNKKIPHILEVNALLARESISSHGLTDFFPHWIQVKELDFLRSAGSVFVVSDHLKGKIAPENSLVKINPNGVDTVLFDPTRVQEDIRKIHGIVQSYVVGWVGSFSLGRGIDAFLEIAEKLSLIQTDICFLIVGDGPLKQWVENQIQARGLQENVVLPGAVPRQKVPLYIAAMDIALAPYPESGASYFSPLKVFEYMAMGKAVAATDMGQCSALLKEGAGLLLPVGEPSLWADKIKQLLHSPEDCLAMGEKARQRVLSDYTWEKNAQRILQQFARNR
jgi:glycosyltransferase involved in cell wall biosynthesis